MANEAVLLIETELPIPFTCDNGTGIEKGTLLKMTDPMTVAATTAADEVFAGVAAEEKIASDGKTKIGVYMKGIFKMTVVAGGTTTVGNEVVLGGANQIDHFDTLDREVGKTIGRALETGAAGETVAVLVG